MSTPLLIKQSVKFVYCFINGIDSRLTISQVRYPIDHWVKLNASYRILLLLAQSSYNYVDIYYMELLFYASLDTFFLIYRLKKVSYFDKRKNSILLYFCRFDFLGISGPNFMDLLLKSDLDEHAENMIFS